MQVFLQSLLANVVLGLGIISIILIIRIFKDKIKNVNLITALTVGLILALVFLGFLPELIENINWKIIWIWILAWIIIFYILELLVHWHHCHELKEYCHHHDKDHKSSILMFSSTFVHNAIHWIVLFSAFSVSLSLGIITTIWVFLHSIPQNVANYFASMKNEKLVYIAAIAGVIWTIILFPFTKQLLEYKWIIISIIAWWLLYTALSDILPENKNMETLKWKFLYLLFVILWILIFVWLHHIEEFIK